MNILHLWDQAGVACILAKYHRRIGHNVKILKRAGYDPFKIFQFYQEPLLDMDGKGFLKHAVKEAAKYDVVHVHSVYKIIPDLRRKYPDKKLVLHYHGSEIRDKNNDPVRRAAESKVDIIIGSTQDLQEFVNDMVYVPNPVDTEHFTSGNVTGDRAFTIKSAKGDAQRVLNYLESNNIWMQLDIIDREANPISYSEIPTFLKRYRTYVDIKYVDGILLHAMSKTGLESLACGLTVLNYELKLLHGLPKDHFPEVVASKLLGIYESIA
ncbi:MAG TPA: glycosyltransferase [Nitrososphaera sp.]|nr:glycosyltransferase [Nitrososphaera sp.]